MCLSWTNTGLYYINYSLLSLYSRLDISFNHSIRIISRTVTFCPPKRCDRGPLLLPLACRQYMFCVPGRDHLLYLVEPRSHDLIHHCTGVLIRLHAQTMNRARRTIMPAVALHHGRACVWWVGIMVGLACCVGMASQWGLHVMSWHCEWILCTVMG